MGQSPTGRAEPLFIFSPVCFSRRSGRAQPPAPFRKDRDIYSHLAQGVGICRGCLRPPPSCRSIPQLCPAPGWGPWPWGDSSGCLCGARGSLGVSAISGVPRGSLCDARGASEVSFWWMGSGFRVDLGSQDCRHHPPPFKTRSQLLLFTLCLSFPNLMHHLGAASGRGVGLVLHPNIPYPSSDMSLHPGTNPS